MIKNYLLITFRNLLKNKLFIIINVFGMGIAIATCVTAYVNWEFSHDWDASQVNGKRIYRVQFNRDFQDKHERYGIAPMPLARNLRQNSREVSNAVRYHSVFCDMRIGEEVFNTHVAYADSAFFDLFTFKFLAGSPSEFFDKGKLLVSDEIAKKYYNSTDVVGKPVTQIVLGKDGVRRPKEFIIGGVYKQIPFNSSFQFGAISIHDNFWEVNRDSTNNDSSWKHFTTLFLQIDDENNVPAVTAQLKNYVEPQNKVREDFKVTSYYLERFDNMMHANRQNPRVYSDELRGGIPPEAVTAPAIMAGLLLLLACFNFTNTSIAISSRRLKEIGIRKVMGGMRTQLILQFLGENLLLCFFGLAVGLLIAEWMVPAYDSLWPWLELTLSYTEHVGFLVFLSGLLAVTALIAGGYPSFYITSFEPVSILKGTARFGGTNWFTRILLGGQFTISLLAIIMGVAFYNNGQFQKDYDLGFAKQGVISAWVVNEAGFNTYRDALSSNKDIELIAGTKNHIANSFYNDPVKFESIVREIDIMDIGENYFDVMDMKLVSGRNFIKDSETDRKESVLVTEELVKQYGWKDSPIGKRLVWSDTVQLYVVGVVKNIYSRALWLPIQPLMIRYVGPEKYQQLLVKARPEHIASVNEFMEKKWKEVFPNTIYEGLLIDREMQETNDINRNVVIMFGFLGFFAALMTGIGMFSLVSLNIVKKMKEIGVRKVLGASTMNIAGVINMEFIINLSIASVLGGALGYFSADMLMDSIWEYYLKMGWASLMLCALLMFVIALLAVGYKTISTASLNPTRTLRDE